jgi:hypothetical protein
VTHHTGAARAARGLEATQGLGEAGGRVAAQRLAVAEARYLGVERGQALRGCGGGRRIGVEDPEHRLAIVAGQRVAGDEDRSASNHAATWPGV